MIYRRWRYDIRQCRMIYLLRKHDIISVPPYAEGIYHPPKVDIISKIYHPFRQERISLKKASFVHQTKETFFMAEKERLAGNHPLKNIVASGAFAPRAPDAPCFLPFRPRFRVTVGILPAPGLPIAAKPRMSSIPNARFLKKI